MQCACVLLNIHVHALVNVPFLCTTTCVHEQHTNMYCTCKFIHVFMLYNVHKGGAGAWKTFLRGQNRSTNQRSGMILEVQNQASVRTRAARTKVFIFKKFPNVHVPLNMRRHQVTQGKGWDSNKQTWKEITDLIKNTSHHSSSCEEG